MFTPGCRSEEDQLWRATPYKPGIRWDVWSNWSCDAQWCEADGARCIVLSTRNADVSKLDEDVAGVLTLGGCGDAAGTDIASFGERGAAELVAPQPVAGIAGWTESPRRTSIRSHWNHGSFASADRADTARRRVGSELRRRCRWNFSGKDCDRRAEGRGGKTCSEEPRAN